MSRISDNLLYQKTQNSITRNRSEMLKNQEKASSGKRINRASDDPIGLMRANRLKTEIARNERVESNLDYVNGMMAVTDTALGDLTDLVSRARELAVQMSSSSNQNESSRLAMAKEVEQLKERAVQVGNTRYGDRYVFSGYQTDRAPFDAQGSFYGDDGNIQIELDGGQKIQINVPGTAAFFGVDEVPQDGQMNRLDERHDGIPTIEGSIREPATILAGNRDIDAKDEDDFQSDEFKALKKRSGVNLIGAIDQFAEGLREGNIAKVQETLDSFEKGLQQVISVRSTVGARQNSIDRALAGISSAQFNNQSLLSDTQDTDVARVFSDMARQEHVLEAAMKTNEKLITPSLLEFLR